MKTYRGTIFHLDKDDVFVFGSNLDGFHGAGAAGYASFLESGNVWRKYNYHNKPYGWKGAWNIKGVAEGYQVGTCGASYALPTISKCGKKCSLSLDEIKINIEVFYDFARDNPEKTFYVAQTGKPGLNGHNPKDLAVLFSNDIPENVVFEESFAELILEYKEYLLALDEYKCYDIPV
jgi:hypothetical protein